MYIMLVLLRTPLLSSTVSVVLIVHASLLSPPAALTLCLPPASLQVRDGFRLEQTTTESFAGKLCLEFCHDQRRADQERRIHHYKCS